MQAHRVLRAAQETSPCPPCLQVWVERLPPGEGAEDDPDFGVIRDCGFGGSDNDSDFDPDLEDEEGSGDDESWGDGSESAGLSSDGEDYNPWGGQGSTSDDDEGW